MNDIWGGELLTEWNVPVWEHDLNNGLPADTTGHR